ncbi:MAG: hypothetical protein KDC53_09530, partial [Saprospiraceae bacterium]|nr:hypothetical protein [Saprospiraceae bacterium]
MPLNHQIPSDLKAIYSTHQKSFNFFLLITIVVAGSCKKNVEPLQDNWERAIPCQETPAGLVSIRAFDCGICHREIYEEWKLSTHAHAWTDLQF